MTKLTEKDLQTALANQYIRLGIGNDWNEQNQELNKAREIMKKHNITNEDITKVFGTSEQLEQVEEMEKQALLQGNKFITCMYGWFYVMDYDMNLTGF